MEIPVYLFTGFLESGKTSFIRDLLNDPNFAEGERTLLFLCEEGEEELEPELLAESNTYVISIEDKSDLNATFLALCDKKYKPERVIFEMNGMWKLSELPPKVFPKHWMLYQTCTTVDFTTFDSYFTNLGGYMFEMLSSTDMIVFNRCPNNAAETIKARRVKMINRRAAIFMDFLDGRSEPYEEDLIADLDLTQEIIDIDSDMYGLWYFDAMEHPDKYHGKTVRFLAQSYRPQGMQKNTFAAGRFAMVCCADDIQFMAVVCRHPDAEKLVDRAWFTITAEVRAEDFPEYQGVGPVLYVKKLKPAKKPDEEVVILN